MNSPRSTTDPALQAASATADAGACPAGALPWARHVVDGAPQALAAFDAALRCRIWNPALAALSGVAARDALGTPVQALRLPGLHPLADAPLRRALRGHAFTTEVHQRVAGQPRLLALRCGPLRDASGSIVGVLVEIDDVSERERQRAQSARANRLYRLIGGIGQAVMRAADRQVLFDEICRIAVDHGGFQVAWIGLFCEREWLRPVAHAGEAALLGALGLDRADMRYALAPSVAARLLQGRPLVCNDVARDPLLSRWRSALLAHDGRSLIKQPLIADGRVIGVLSLTAAQPNFFDADEVDLLRRTAQDIGDGIRVIEQGERLRFLAYHDGLTGLWNREGFEQQLGARLAEASEKRPVAVVLLDIDDFKLLNDRLGERTGNALLIAVARRLQRYAGRRAEVARLGADVFAATLPVPVDPQAALRIAERVMRYPFRLARQRLRLSARVGIAFAPQHGHHAGTLLRGAELALKHAKRAHQRVAVYVPSMRSALHRRMDMVTRLRHALADGTLDVHYQPKVDLHAGVICGAEALLRWTDAQLGAVSPAQFVPLLEESALISAVGDWVLDRVRRDAALLRQADGSPLRVAINVSPTQLRALQPTVRPGDGDPCAAFRSVDIEITEAVMMTDMAHHVACLNRLRDYGVRIAIDDFGTGYSSLAYLSRLPIHDLKIDRAFVAAIGVPGNLRVVSAIISLAHALGLKVIAEGVETAEQLATLRSLGCDQIQGWLFWRAMPARELGELLARQQAPAGAILLPD